MSGPGSAEPRRARLADPMSCRSSSRRAPNRMLRLVVGCLAAVVVMSGCRVETAVNVTIDRDGAGIVDVVVTADAELAAAAPGLAEDFRADDLRAAGWSVDGPTPTDDGGLRVTISRPFTTPEEATAILRQVSGDDGPLRGLSVVQSATRTRIATTVTGSLLVPDVGAFADAGLVEAIGTEPYEQVLAERGLTLPQAVGLSFTVTMPGEIEETTGVAGPYDKELERTTVVWTGALGGAATAEPGQELAAVTALDDDGARRAQQLRDFATWALPAWLVFFVLVIVPVTYLVRRRR